MPKTAARIRPPPKATPEQRRTIDQTGLRVRELRTAIAMGKKAGRAVATLELEMAAEKATLPNQRKRVS